MMYETEETISDKKYNKLNTDYKAEVVAANFLKYYKDFSAIFLKKMGTNERPYLKDIKGISTTYYGFDEKAIVIESYRESIYDYLPEGLFHPPSLGGNSGNVEKVVKEIKRQKSIEENARKFFQPFEAEFFYTEINALLKEMELDVNDKSNALIDILAELWPLLKKVEIETAKILVYILPFLHEVKGNTEWISRFLSAFTNVPVSISYTRNCIDQQNDELGLTLLGNTKLGITFIPSGKHYDGERNWQINYGPIPYDHIYQYVNGHPFRQLLRSIYDELMPMTVKIEENFMTEKTENSFILNTDHHTSRLGYSTFI